MTDEKLTRKRGRRPDPPAKMVAIIHYADSNGNAVAYDATDKSPDEYPEELKAAIKAKSKQFHRDIIIPKFWRWVDGLKPEDREAFTLAARSEDPEIRRQFEGILLKWYDAFWGKKTEDPA